MALQSPLPARERDLKLGDLACSSLRVQTYSEAGVGVEGVHAQRRQEDVGDASHQTFASIASFSSVHVLLQA